MIDLNELRIGNLVMYKKETIIVDDIISNCGINMHHDCWLYNLQDINPIPLTECLIVNSMGFEKNKLNEYVLSKGGFKLIIIEGNDFVLKIVDQVVCYNPIKTVHQLQNIFYSLTGKEIDIKIT